MSAYPRNNLVLGLVFLAFAVFVAFIWIPLDTETGIVETVRRKFVIGDALGPTVAGGVIALGAVLLWLRPGHGAGHGASMTLHNLGWLLALLALFAVSLMVMRYAGPLAASGVDGGYRPLRATPPWHYIGFVLGGTVMVGGLMSLVSREVKPTFFLLGFIAALIIALLYDVPFDDLILPPNGDV